MNMINAAFLHLNLASARMGATSTRNPFADEENCIHFIVTRKNIAFDVDVDLTKYTGSTNCGIHLGSGKNIITGQEIDEDDWLDFNDEFLGAIEYAL